MSPATTATDTRGRSASKPSEIPTRGWTDVLLRTFRKFNEHRILSLAAGITYYALLAIFPALAALVAVYSKIGNPQTITAQLQSLSSVMPGGAISVISDQVKVLAAQPSSTLGIAFFGGLAVSLWSASSGVKALFDALNVIHDEPERRSFIKLSAIALLFTLGAIAAVLIGFAVTVAVPAFLRFSGLQGPMGWLISVVRWPLMLVGVGLALAITYRFGPSRAVPRWQWVSWGSAFAAIGWLVVSGVFSWYAANFGRFNATYGSLGAVIGFMMWLWLSSAVVLLGAQINAELEHQTGRDTTEGPDKPRGARGARMADTVGRAQD